MKLFFLDIDGTIAMPGSDPTPELADAIRRLQAQGDKVYLCTGRTLGFVPESTRRLGCDGGIYSAGGHVIAEGEELFRVYLSRELRDRITAGIAQIGATYFLECERGNFAGGVDISEQAQRLREDPSMHSELQRVLSRGFQRIPISAYREEPVFKISFMLYSRDQIPKVRELTPEGMGLVLFDSLFPSSPVLCGEFSQPGTDKGTAMLRICDRYGLTQADCVAFGDSMNDAPVLMAAGEGVAMGNADQAVKDLADRVCGGCRENGLAIALAEYIRD